MIPSGATPVCIACFRTLTAEERHYYEYRCEQCEGKWHARLVKWIEGGEDWDIDAEAGFLLCQECKTQIKCASRRKCDRPVFYGHESGDSGKP